MEPVKPYAKVYGEVRGERSAVFTAIFLGDHDPKKIKNFCVTGKYIFSILSQLSAL